MGTHERKEREKEQRREDIISAAQRVFFEKGFTTTTMDEIAEAAELSKGTLYLYYKSKEDLYLAVMLRGSRLLYRMFKEAVDSSGSTIEQLLGLFESYYRFFNEHRNYFRMFQFFENQQFHKQVSDEMLQCCAESDNEIWALVTQVIRSGVDEGILRSDLRVMEMGTILWSSSNALMRRIDSQYDLWLQRWDIDLEKLLRTSNGLLLEAIMTEEAKLKYRSLLYA